MINYQAQLDKFKPLILNWFKTTNGRLLGSIVLIPAIFSALYLYMLAPDRYVSEAHLSVYDSSVAQASNDIFSSLGLGTGQSNTDLQLLQAYLQSGSIVRLAEEKLNLKEHYSNSRDFIFGLDKDASFESFHTFFLQHAYAAINQETGLLTITAEAYDPEFALELNKFLVAEGERIINQLNQDVARSEMGFAEEEIARSLKILQQRQNELAEFQSRTNIASPESEGESLIQIIYSMEASLAEAKAKLGETLTYLSPTSPQAKALKAKINALETQIDEQKSRITDADGDTKALSSLGIEYNELRFQVELAQVVYETAVSSYELARSQATKKLKHLLVPSPPSLPETAELPNRGYWLLTLLLVYLALYGIARMVLRSIREHQD